MSRSSRDGSSYSHHHQRRVYKPHAEYRRSNEIPKYHIIGRMAVNAQVQFDVASSALETYFTQEGLDLSLLGSYLAEVGYRPFRKRIEQGGLDRLRVESRISDLGGVSARAINAYRTDLHLSKLTSTGRGKEVYQVLGYIDHALDNGGRDVTVELYEHHDELTREFGNKDYPDPVLHLGFITCSPGVGTNDWFKDCLPVELEKVVPDHIRLPPVSLIELPRLPD